MQDNLKQRDVFLRSLIDREALLIHANESGFVDQPRVRESLQRLADQVCINYYYEHFIAPQLQVTELELRRAYMRSFIQIHARHLYAPTYEKALALRERLQQGETFEQLAKETFRDTYLASHGGDLGWFSFGEMEPTFEDSAYALPVGRISAPVKTRYGYSIIQVISRRINPFLREDDFQRKKNWLLLEVKQRKQRDFLKEKTDEILASLNLKLNLTLLEKLYQQLPQLQDSLWSFNPENLIGNADTTYFLQSRNNPWDFRKLLQKLREVQPRQWNRVKNFQDFTDLVKGLAIRGEIERRIADLNIKQLPDVQQEILSVQQQRIIQLLLETVYDTMTVPDSLLYSYYQENAGSYTTPAMVEISELAVGDSALAYEILKKLSSESFSDLAQRYSLLERSRDKGGYLGWNQLELFGSLKEKIWAAKKEEVIGPLPIANLYLLLKVHDKKNPEPLSFQEAREEVKQDFWYITQRRAYFNFLNKIKTNIEVELDSTLLRELTLSETAG